MNIQLTNHQQTQLPTRTGFQRNAKKILLAITLITFIGGIIAIFLGVYADISFPIKIACFVLGASFIFGSMINLLVLPIIKSNYSNQITHPSNRVLSTNPHNNFQTYLSNSTINFSNGQIQSIINRVNPSNEPTNGRNSPSQLLFQFLPRHTLDNSNEQVNDQEGLFGFLPSPSLNNSNEQVGQLMEKALDRLAKDAEKEPLTIENLQGNNDLYLWLNRLQSTADYKNNKQHFSASIYPIIEHAERDEEYRTIFLNTIHEATATCGDRVSLSILHVDILFQIAKSLEAGNLPELAYILGHGSWALDELSKIAANKASVLQSLGDEIEVYLAYPIKLKKVLKLPIHLNSMLYFRTSRVSKRDLRQAKKLVKDFLSNKESYYSYLSQDPTWQEALKRYRPQEFQAIVTKRDEAADQENPDYEQIDQAFKQDIFALTDKVLTEVGRPPFLKKVSEPSRSKLNAAQITRFVIRVVTHNRIR